MFTTQNSSVAFSVLERATFPLVGKAELWYCYADIVKEGRLGLA
jgi:hypothetical protein